VWPAERTIHEDEALRAIDKPPGVQIATRGVMQPLDREASGLLLSSKNKTASKMLAAQLEQGVERSWIIGATRRPKRSKGFHIDVVSRCDDRLLMRVTSTERRQPIRLMFAHAGAPLAGDRDNAGAPATRLMLHAERMVISHPDGGRLELSAPTPAAFARWLNGNERRLPRDDAELDARLGDAIARRFELSQADRTNAYRIVNGSGDALPGVDIDRYGEHAVVALRSEAAVTARDRLLDAVARLGFDGVYLKVRPKHASVVVDTRADDLAPRHASRGSDAPSPMIIHEAGLDYEVRLGDGLSTGIFLDQRDARKLVREHANGKRVLNLFAYHAAFSVAAIAGGAASTVTVDASGVAIDRARANLALHGFGDHADHSLVRADAWRYLDRAAERSERFDLVILDPPSFATTKSRTFRAIRDYRKLAAAALRCTAPGGWLLACTNHRGVNRAKLQRHLRQAAADAGVTVTRMRGLANPPDFPAAPGEDGHLKRVLLQIEP